MSTSSRNPNFEILRVFAMLCVILSHFLAYGVTHNGDANVNVSFFNGFWLNSIIYPFISALTAMGVISYVMITSYFICEKKTLKLDKVLGIWLETLFYSTLLALICSSYSNVPIKGLLLSVVPIWSSQYWFVDKYIGLILLAPFFSYAVNGLSKKGMGALLCVLCILTVTITNDFPNGGKFFAGGQLSLPTFVLIFFLAAYIKKFGEGEFLRKYSKWIFIGGIAIQGLLGVGLNYLYRANCTIYGGFSVGYNALSLIPGIGLFVWFKNHTFNNTWFTKCLVSIAPFVFAAYLIHENQYFRWTIWKYLDSAPYWSSPVWLLFLIFVPIVILLTSCAIDVVRTYLFKISRIDHLIEKVREHNISIE